MLKVRIRTALIVLPLFLAALFYLPTIGWALFLVPWLLIGAWEWAMLAKWPLVARRVYLLLLIVLGLVLWELAVVQAHAHTGIMLYGIALIFWVVAAPLWLARGWLVRDPLLLALTGIIVLLPLWLALVRLQAEPGVLLMLMATLWISDTAAYFCGKRWGRHKLAPSVSPGKTWEGVAGAMVAVTLYYAVLTVTVASGHPVLNGVLGLAIFLALTILGVEGDLFESWIKRGAGVKDSGTALPGHGGILDRVDALTSSMPAAALLLACLA